MTNLIEQMKEIAQENPAFNGALDNIISYYDDENEVAQDIRHFNDGGIFYKATGESTYDRREAKAGDLRVWNTNLDDNEIQLVSEIVSEEQVELWNE